MKLPKQLITYTINPDNSITLKCDACYVKIYLLTNDIIRIRTAFSDEFPEESYVLTTVAWKDRFDSLFSNERQKIIAIKPQITDTEANLHFTTDSLKITINKSPYYIQIFNNQEQLIYSDLKSKPYVEDQLGRIYHYTEIDIEKDYFYGFGEKTGSLNKLRRRLVQNAKDTLGYDPENSDPLYKHIPFYIKLNAETKHAIGLFYHNTYEAVFDMGVDHSNYHHRYSYYSADGGDLDLFVINGPSLAKVIEGYTSLTGKSAMLPAYALGYLGSTMYYVELPENCDQEIISFVEKCRNEDIPIDNFHLSSGYTVDSQNKRQLFTWNNQKFPEPSKYFATMHKLGVPVTPNIKPGVLTSNPNYQTMADQRIFIAKATGHATPYVDYWWGGMGSFVDFTKESSRDKWQQYVTDSLLKHGVTSLWNDNCEYDSLADKDAYCDFDGKGAKLAKLKSIQPNLMAYTGRQAMLKYNPNLRPYSVNRGGFAGIQRYSQTWAGDNYTSWQSLKFNIATILGMGLSGVANNGCDIGGFWGPHPDPELFVRWVQNGIFQPRFSIHSCNTNNTVTEPWMYGEHTHQIREAIRLRYRLMPYFYSLMREAHLLGTPIMRPLVYEFQNDLNIYNEGVDFMLGSSLFIANVVEPKVTSREVYLPNSANWYDFNGYQKHHGGTKINLAVTLDSIPIFIRDNAIIALSNDEAKLDDGQFQHLELIVGGKDGEFNLYQDDGLTNNYLKGSYRNTLIRVNRIGEQTKISFKHEGSFIPHTNRMELKLINQDKGPFFVTIDGRKIKQFLHRDKFSQIDEGWYYSTSKGVVEIKTTFPNNDSEIIVSFAHFDLIGM